MRKKRNIQRKKDRFIVWIAGCLLLLLSVGYGSLYALETQTPKKTTSKLTKLYVLNEGIRSSSTQNISINAEAEPLLSVLKRVAQKVNVGISYQEDIIPGTNVTVHIEDADVFQVLKVILKGTGLKTVLPLSRDVLVIKKKLKAKKEAQIGSITGTITNEDGEPVPTANVLLVEIGRGAATNLEGEYTISDVPADTYTLRVTYIGYQEYTDQITIEDGQELVKNVTLQEGAVGVEELVVVGYGVQEEGTVTSAISTVGREQIKDISVTSTDLLLQGQSAGVRVVSGSGGPGSGVSVRIRGTSSISGGMSPLYIVDGVPIVTGNFARDGGGFPTSALAYLNPNDIISMTILKDASATAIYGARAANGVVLIETRQGADKPLQIQFGTHIGTTKAVDTPNMVTGSQHEKLMNEAARNNGNPIPFANPNDALNTDWIDIVFRPGFVQNYNLSLSGGSEEIRYAVTGSHFNQKGILLSKRFKRSTARVDLGLDATEDLTFSTGLSYSFTNRNRSNTNSSLSGILSTAINIPRNIPVYQPDGSYTLFSIFGNPIAAAKERDFNMDVTRFIGDISAEYDFLPGLIGKTTWSYDRQVIKQDRFSSSRSTAGSAVNGTAESSAFTSLSWTGAATLNYITDVSNHYFDLLIGGSLNARIFDYTLAEGSRFPSDQFRRIASAAVVNASSSGRSTGLVSLFGRLQYNYDQRYLATFTVRRDGSSRFGRNQQWGTFPSVGLGWVISEESFFDIGSISSLKLRASYGITGNQAGIGSYQSLGLWSGSNYAEIPGTAPEQLSNPNLKWETTSQFDIGLDMGLFNERITITYDYYRKYTTDLLLAVPVPYTTGFSEVVKNIGEVSNKGMELSISADIIQNQDWFWNVRFNIAGNRNMIEKLASPFTVTSRNLQLYKEGISMYSFYLHKQLGVDPQTGAPIYVDANGDGVFDPNTDRTILGNANPDFFGGITNSIDYEQFNLSVFFQYSYGNKMLYMNRYFLEHGGTRVITFLTSQLDRWQEPGDITMVPKMTSENYRASVFPSRLLSDGSFIRLKNVSLDYNLTTEFANKLGITGARIYVSGQNLFIITNYIGLNPGLNFGAGNNLVKGIEFSTMPLAKKYIIGFNITF